MIINMKCLRHSDILGAQHFSTSLKLSEIEGNFEVPVYNKDKDNDAYQRLPKESRVNAVKERFLEAPSDPHCLLDNININIRSTSALKAHCNPMQGEKDAPGNFYTYQYIKGESPKFMLVDGQTRIRGALRAITDSRESNDTTKLEQLENIRVNVNLTFTDKYREGYIFFLINNYSKNLPPDGAARLILEGYKRGDINFKNEVGDQSFAGAAAGRRRKIEILAMMVAEILNDKSDVWLGKVRDYNEGSGGRGVTLKTVANNLIKPLYMELESRKDKMGEKDFNYYVFEVMDAYWTAIKNIFPEAFGHDASNYNILKASQAEIMQRLLVSIVKSDDQHKIVNGANKVRRMKLL